MPDRLGQVMAKQSSNPKLRISFASGGTAARNIELLQKAKPPELLGKSLYDLAYKTLSKEDLIPLFPNGKSFAKKWKKEPKLVSPNLDNVILVDDYRAFIEHSGTTGIDFGKVYTHYDSWQLAHAAARNPNGVEQKYIPKTQEAWFRHQQRFARIDAIIEQSLDDLEHGSKRSFAELIGQHNAEKRDWVNIGLHRLNQEAGIACGLEKLGQLF